MIPHRGNRSNRRPMRTRAETRAETRRSRAISHLQRVRGQAPPKRAPRALFAAAAALALAAGATSGVSLARGSEWLAPDAPLVDVSVVGALHLGALDVATAAAIDPRAGHAEISLEEIEHRLEAHAWIAHARALRLPGGRLLLNVEERVPAALVGAGGSDQRFLADASGTPFAEAPAEPDSSLLRIVTPGTPPLLEPHAEIARAIRLARDLPSFGLSPATEIALANDPTGLTLRLESRSRTTRPASRCASKASLRGSCSAATTSIPS
ncbi:MAG: FtsQ-type POTRA domain-containing protein [Deltaproteobacteria bacterium]|nr:FtsQ-type POTRA domain-containing protein [Deltaproteobacteria bacterium]